jgi:transposase-like protein
MMLAETQEIVSELTLLRGEKIRIAAVPTAVRLKIVALAQKFGLQKVCASCSICPSTVRKWREFSEQKISPLRPQKSDKNNLVQKFTVTQLTVPTASLGVITIVRLDGASLQVPERSVLAEKIVTLFLGSC